MRRMLLVLAISLAAPVLALQEVEVIPLRHQTPERLLPALQPLLEPAAP